jgi:hypothetical protein
MNSFGYSCIPEIRIIQSFKRFVEEKRKNSFPYVMNEQQPFVEHTPTQETITYQSQVISCYYSIEDQQQNQFWENLELNNREELSKLNDEDFYIRILQEITKYFGIQRNSPNLQPFLENKVIYAYNGCGNRIYLDQILRFDQDQHVGIGMMTKNNTPVLCKTDKSDDENIEKWIVKWNTTPEVGENLTLEESEKWKLIESTGAHIPKVLTGFMILDFTVVVMERLYPLEPQDYNQKLVMSITSFIEKLLPIGVNNNLKPSNIMKRIDKNNEITYLVSDIRLMTTLPLFYGYKRLTWSPFWASQVMDLNTITTVKNDLIELSYVLTYLSQMNKVNNEEEYLELLNQIRIIEKPKEILDWSNRVRIINEQDILMKDFLDLKKLALAFPKFNNYDSLVFDECI